MTRVVRGIMLTLSIIALSACGGGGSEDGGGNSTPPPPQRGVLGFIVSQSAADENSGTVSVALTRTSGSDGEVGATVSITGSASSGSDFTAPSTVTFAAGATTASIPVPIVNDSEAEADETISLTLSAPSGGATLGTATTYTLTIQNDDAPTAPAVSISSSTKRLNFSWAPTPTSTHYQLLSNASGGSGFAAVLPDITSGTNVSLPIAVHRHDWAATRYRVAACNAAGCTQSGDASPTAAHMLAAIGSVTSSNIEANDHFGDSITLSADGNTMAIGAPAEDSASSGVNGDPTNNFSFNSGAVYVFAKQANGQWEQQAYLKASNTRETAGFGSSVSVSEDGNTLVVGAPDESSGATVVNGDQGNMMKPSAGAAYVFSRSAGGQWVQTSYLKAANSGIGDHFGTSVKISGDGRAIAVGAPHEDGSAILVNGADDDSWPDTGAVYLFEVNASSWQQTAYVKPHLRIAVDAHVGLGNDVAISRTGDRLAIASQLRGIFIYSKTNTDWEFETVLQAGRIGLGEHVALSADGRTVVASNRADSLFAEEQRPGAAFVFTRDATGAWSQPASLGASNSTPWYYFGTSLAIGAQGDCIAVGSTNEPSSALGVGGNPFDTAGHQTGATYFFVRNAANEWVQQTYIKAPTMDVAFFGTGLAMNADCSVLTVGNLGSIGTPASAYQY